MEKYIGVKLIEAEPMTLEDFNDKITKVENEKFNGNVPLSEIRHVAYAGTNHNGYLVKYSDNYESWSPQDSFERAYILISSNKNLKTDISISQEMVDKFIEKVEVSTIGDKTTLVRATLINGFEIVESASCVDPANYSEDMGKTICMDKIKDKIWSYLGFFLQSAIGGFKHE